jgi:hypothetical protein
MRTATIQPIEQMEKKKSSKSVEKARKLPNNAKIDKMARRINRTDKKR